MTCLVLWLSWYLVTVSPFQVVARYDTQRACEAAMSARDIYVRELVRQ